MRSSLILLCAFGYAGCATSSVADPPVAAPARTRAHESLEATLAAEFDAVTATPEALRAALLADSEHLADGPLFMLVLPLLAYTNLVLSGHRSPAEALPRMRILLDGLIAEAGARVGVSDLARLDDLRGHATWLGELALALGAWRLAGGDARDEALHARLTEVLAGALRQTEGAPLRSYPHLRWSFDTTPALVALRVRDVVTRGDAHRDAIARALAWGDAHVDATTGIPGSRMALAGDEFTDVPRGSDLALRIALLAELDPTRARRMYERFVAHFQRVMLGVPAFAEWPDGLARDADRDSGPIVMGVGIAATGFGLAAARAVGDGARATALGEALRRLPALRARVGGTRGWDDARRVTGSLSGDAAMFWAVTWTDWRCSFTR